MKLVSFNCDEITQYLPQEYPFIYVDKAYDITPGEKGFGIKNVTLNEWFFQGHFPTQKIVPGVLIIEAMGQLIALVEIARRKVNSDASSQLQTPSIGFLTKVDVKFIGLVAPSDQIILECEHVKTFKNLSQWKVSAKVGRKVVATGNLSVAEKK